MTRSLAILAVAVLAATAACGGSPSITAHGSFEVSDLDGSTSQAYPDINPGTQVIVINSDNDTIGTGSLKFGSISMIQGETDYYTFAVTVPGGQARYGIRVGSGHGTIWQSAAQMAAGPSLCLGNGC